MIISHHESEYAAPPFGDMPAEWTPQTVTILTDAVEAEFRFRHTDGRFCVVALGRKLDNDTTDAAKIDLFRVIWKQAVTFNEH